MNLTSRFSAPIAVALCLLAGCASAPQSGIERGAADVKVYQSDTLSPSQYEVVRRVWVDSWRSAFLVPTYPSEAEGIAALQTEAARVGADGLINVICLDQGRSKWSQNPGPAVSCYGNAIRVRSTQG